MNATVYIWGILLQAVAGIIALLQARHAPRRLPWLLIAISSLLIVARRTATLGQFMKSGQDLAAAEVLTLIISLLFFFGVVLMSRMFRDIVNGRRSLQESEERYRALFDRSLDLVYVTDFKGNFIDANASALKRLGYTREEIRSLNFASLLSEDQLLTATKALQEIRETGINKDMMEFRLRHKNGSDVYVETRGSTVMSDGTPIALQGIARDVTDRKRAEETLRENEARFRSYFELPLIGIAITSPEKGWLKGNDRLSAILGYSWPELEVMTWSELTYPEDLPADVKQFNSILAGEINSYMIEKRFIRKNGEVIWTSLAAGCVRKNDGAVDYFVVLLDDITERKMSVERMRKALGATINAMSVTVEARDPYTAGHQRRVADLARSIAMEMNLSADQIDGIRMAATIHDLGKISVPAEILSKPAKLTAIEFSLVKTHSQVGYDILKDIDFPWPVAQVVFQHHERMDGSGYPNGLKGDDILLEARIIAVSDVVESMSSHRPYRPALGIDTALNEIEKNKGIFYDKAVADACLRLFRERGFQLEGT